jgi:hypothetical protein
VAALFYDYPQNNVTPTVGMPGVGGYVGYSFLISGQRLNGYGIGARVNSASPPAVELSERASSQIVPLVGAPPVVDGSIADIPFPVALQGHYALYKSSTDALLGGDSDEPFDAIDSQNLFIGYFPADPELGSATPSFVRPALINYILNEGGQHLAALSISQLKAICRLLQRSTLRPIPILNDPFPSLAPEGVRKLNWGSFTGSNPRMGTAINFAETRPDVFASQLLAIARELATGGWDVDNNGDGIPDSVWIDIGMQPFTTPDGKVVKPLAAYRIEDLGGRIDVNAAGSLAYFVNAADINASGGIGQTSGGITNVLAANPEATFAESVRGFGTGPADMTLRTMFLNANFGRELLLRRYGIVHGDMVAGKDYDELSSRMFSLLQGAQVSTGNDFFGAIRDPFRDNVHRLFGRAALPCDVWGRGKVVLDIAGQPTVSGLSSNFTWGTTTPHNLLGTFDEVQNDPYEMLHRAYRLPDAAFSVAHLEALLRRYDWGTDSLPAELKNLVEREVEYEISANGLNFRSDGILPREFKPGFFDLASQITVNSNCDAGPSAVLPPDLRTIQSGSLYGSELNAPHRFVPIRVFQRLFNPPSSATPLERWRRYMSVVPHEVRLGRKFDLNRPLGNQIDDDNDGYIDTSREPNVSNTIAVTNSGSTLNVYAKQSDFTPETTRMLGGPPPSNPTMANRYGKLDLQGHDGRQLYARHLYSMLSFMMSRESTSQTVFNFPVNGAILSAPEIKRLNQRKLAQWAINAVDFRDPDSVMTGFEFDENPFDGWDVDGDLTTVEPTNRGVVWGMESPAMLLTESLAFHDRRVNDTGDDASMQKRLPSATSTWGDGDDDVDQLRIPQGSLYLELYVPKSVVPFHNPTGQNDTRTNPLGAVNDLYTSVPSPSGSGNSLALQINRLAPDRNPVWRIGISRAHNADNPDATAANNSPLRQISQQKRDVLTFQPEDPELFQTPVANFQFDRVIWLASQDPGQVVDSSTMQSLLPADSPRRSIYYSRTPSSTSILAGQYGIVAPRLSTVIGSANKVPDSSDPASTIPSQQRIELTDGTGSPGNSISIFADKNTIRTPVNDAAVPGLGQRIRPITTVVAAADPPTTAWNWPIGINISEPVPNNSASYYQRPDKVLNGDFPAAIADAYRDYVAANGVLPDKPLDEQGYAPLSTDFVKPQATGTHLDYKTAYLQRLADPSQRYHPQQNPYLTVDWISLDLTVFSGDFRNKKERDADMVEQWLDPSDDEPFTSAPDERFATRYKSGANYLINNPPNATGLLNNIFSYHTIDPGRTNGTGSNVIYFDHLLLHDTDMNQGGNRSMASTTLGYLNHSFGRRWEGTLSSPLPSLAAQAPYVGSPREVRFPWIAWNNRPFASPLELTLVPFTSASGIGLEASTPSMLEPMNPMHPPQMGDIFTWEDPVNYRSDYLHCLNFFLHSNDFTKSGNFYRVLDWVGTVDPYDDSTHLILPEHFPGTFPGIANWPPANATEWNVEMPLELFRAPFNLIPKRTRRGVVNLNTLNGRRVFRELMDGISVGGEIRNVPTPNSPDGHGAFYDEFVTSRRGYFTPGNQSFNWPYRLDARFDPDFPTEMAGAFVPGSVADLVPPLRTVNSVSRDWPATSGDFSTVLQRSPVEAGILRPTPPDRGRYTTPGPKRDPEELPLFVRDPSANNLPHQDRDTSAFHRYQGISRLANLTSGQSNNFAAWTTIGFFEVDLDTSSIGVEYGYDEGTNTRHRSFMIIDRSIPVRYEPGKDHNTSDVIVLQRVLN